MGKFFKREEGIGATEGIVAVVILMVFTTLVVSMIYNIYISSNFIKRNSKATDFIVTLFENVEKLQYSDIGFDNSIFKDNLNQLLGEEGTIEEEDGIYYYKCIKGGYTISLYVERYIPKEDQNNLDVVKIITAKVQYKLGTKNKTLEMSKLKTID